MSLRRIGDASPSSDWRSGPVRPPVRGDRAGASRPSLEGEPTPVRGVRLLRLDGYLLFFNEDGDAAEISRAGLAAAGR